MSTFRLFQSLRNPVFARLYAAQTTNLLRDALTWVGLALLAFELADKDSAIALSPTLTLRVTAFVLLAPLAGALADRASIVHHHKFLRFSSYAAFIVHYKRLRK
jgi:NRE family putative nickel resistance protein-like MFS transporter